MIAPTPAARLVQILTVLVLLDSRSDSLLGTGSFALHHQGRSRDSMRVSVMLVEVGNGQGYLHCHRLLLGRVGW